MKYIDHRTQFQSDVPTVITLGKFDGLHRGHQKLLRQVCRYRRDDCRSVVFTIAPDHVPVLLTVEEKRKKLEEYDIDCMIRCPFVPEILGMAPEEFVSEILVKGLKAEHIVVGTDFRFGYERRGDAGTLSELGKKYGYTVEIVEKERYGKREISSTYVREAIAKSDLKLANELLGSAYPVYGIIQHGKQLGRQIGMPTINLIPEPYKLLPPQGVYFSLAEVNGNRYHGVTNVGYKPTVGGTFLGVETYLYGMNEDVYGCEAKIELLEFLRPEQKFASVEKLKTQMECDLRAGKEYFRV